MERNSSGLFWPALLAVTAADRLTKWLAVDRLMVMQIPHPALGDWVRWTLVRNPGAAFGLQIGGDTVSRWLFMSLTILALAILARLYANTRAEDTLRTLALALLCGGAIGNLIDRVTSPHGVVDFIDIGFGNARWPTFNVADSAVCIGACLLTWVLWGEEKESLPLAVAPVMPGEASEAS